MPKAQPEIGVDADDQVRLHGFRKRFPKSSESGESGKGGTFGFRVEALAPGVPVSNAPSFNPYLNPGENPAREPAPGAKAARICGITAIALSLTCVGIPIAIILGIVAIVKSSKAKRLARSHPETYEMPSSAGLILGIVGVCMPVVMLPFVGIVSAIAIPALLSQRARARDKMAITNLVGRLDDLTIEYDRLAEAKQPPEQIKGRLESYLKTAHAQDKNPWNAAEPAYRWTIAEGGPTKDETELVAREQAKVLGQAVFVFTAPIQGRSGFIGGAVRVQNMVNGENTVTKAVAIE